jgi:ATP-dependent helicase HrpB
VERARTALPIDDVLPEILAHLRAGPSLVLEAPPGAGKTTRVPPALLDAGLSGSGDVVVLEPRRLAARLSALRVAGERGERAGETVGYQVRFEDVTGPRTRLRYVTEGIFTRRLLSDPLLRGIGTVVLDEFHERSLKADVALACLLRLQRTARPDMKLLVMSATLDLAPLARHLGCPVVRSEGRRFPVEVEYLEKPGERRLGDQVAAAVRKLTAPSTAGDTLVFLPGAAEIRFAQEACAELSAHRSLLVLPLHGELPPEEQDRALARASKRKIILATNVAETSITIDGVVAVVDSGLARIAGHSPWTGLSTLSVEKISRAAAEQRAGRAGRTAPGRALRLYTRHDHDARPAHLAPEIERLDLAETVLELSAAGLSPRTLPWLDSPPELSLQAALALLARLGALSKEGTITELGRDCARLPLHPRLSRLVLEAHARGEGEAGCALAALLGERDLRTREAQRGASPTGPSDLLELWDLLCEAQAARFAPQRLRALGVDGGVARRVDQARSQLARLLPKASGASAPSAMPAISDVQADAEPARAPGPTEPIRAKRPTEPTRATRPTEPIRAPRPAGPTRATRPPEPTPRAAREELLRLAVLAGFPDRVAKRRAPGSDELLLSAGGAVQLSPGSVVREAPLLVAVDVEERGDALVQRGAGAQQQRARGPRVRLASAIEPEWLLDLFPESMRDTVELVWEPARERVEVTSRLSYDALHLEESRRPPRPDDAAEMKRAAELLLGAARARGPAALGDPEAVRDLRARLSLVAEHCPEAGLRALTDEDLDQALAALCQGRSSFAEFEEADWMGALLARAAALDAEAGTGDGPGLESVAGKLARLAPEHVALPGGRRVRIEYTEGQPPAARSRLQDFFGLSRGPAVASGRVPLVLHLLAPNGRAQQITQDLQGFWVRHYPAVRKELMRKYPRHPWPEDGATASPPAPRPPRRG